MIEVKCTLCGGKHIVDLIQNITKHVVEVDKHKHYCKDKCSELIKNEALHIQDTEW